MRTRLLRIIALVQAAAFALLSLVALGIYGLGVLFAVSDTPDTAAGRHDVHVALGIFALVVLVPCVVTALLGWAGTRVDRSPRGAATALLIAEFLGLALVLQPDLRPWIFGLTPTAFAAVLDLVLTGPAIVLALLTLARGTGHTTGVQPLDAVVTYPSR